MSTKLTETQEGILAFMVRHQAEHSRPPSLREICQEFRYASHTAARKHVQALAKKGFVTDTGDRRTWAAKVQEVQDHLFTIPVFGTIPAGLPVDNPVDSEESIRIDPKSFGLRSSRGVYALHVRGDSMTGAMIADGDIALLRQAEPRPGQIVAAIALAGRDVRVGVRPQERHREGWREVLDQVDALRTLAHARLAPGSRDPGVVRQRSRGKLTCRERIALLLDAGSFHEVGSVAGFASYGDDGKPLEFTPANHVGGWGRIAGRTAIVCADDFTSRGGHADGAIGAKSTHLDRLALDLRAPSLRLLDGSSGGGSVAATSIIFNADNLTAVRTAAGNGTATGDAAEANSTGAPQFGHAAR